MRKITLPPPPTGVDLPLAVIQDAIRRRGEQPPPTDTPDTPAVVVDTVTFYQFVQRAWPVIEGRRRFYPNWHVQAICEFLTAVSAGAIDKLIINMPPGMAKSLLTSVFWQAWDWGPNGRSDRRYLCTSYGGDDASPANRDAERCRDLIMSAWYQGGWGTSYQLSDTQNAKAFYRTTKNGYRISTGLDGGASGQRADIVVIDDPTKLDEDSKAGILHASEVYERTLYSRAQDDGSAFVLVMQRLDPDDLSGYFLKQDGWTHLCLPMFYEQEHRCRVFLSGTLFFEDPRTIEGQPLHEKMTTAIAKAHQQQITRPDIYDGQQQQHPTSRADSIITRIDRWDMLPPNFAEIVITVDCAFKDAKHNSFVVFQKWGRRDATAYLLDQVRDHMALPATCDALVAFCKGLPIAPTKYVEAKANGPAVVQTLQDRVPGLMLTDADPVMKAFCAGSKEAKVQAVASYYRAGNVKIPPKGMFQPDWTIEHVQELTDFPRSRFNDQADAAAMAVWHLLHEFEAHIPVGETFAAGAEQNFSPIAGLFEHVYGGETESVADTLRHAFGD